MRILFIGDIVGRVGRRVIKDHVPALVDKYQIDFVIANGENASHGKGLLRHHYLELIDSGVDCITLGNHYDAKKDLKGYIDRVDRLVRPINLLHEYPGEGAAVFNVNGVNIRVINVLGSAFMKEEVNSPYYSILEALSNDEEDVTINIVDYHAEATGEKLSIAYALDGKVSAVLGTHTHVQTRDYQILENGTAFISDVGMTGFAHGALGLDKDSVVKTLVYGQPGHFESPVDGKGIISAVVLYIDDLTGNCKEIFPIYQIEK